MLLVQHHASRTVGKTWRMVRTRRQYLRERDAALTVIMGVRRWLLRARCNRRKQQALQALARDAKKVPLDTSLRPRTVFVGLSKGLHPSQSNSGGCGYCSRDEWSLGIPRRYPRFSSTVT